MTTNTMAISAALIGQSYGGDSSIVKGQRTYFVRAYGRSDIMSRKAIQPAYQAENWDEAKAFFANHRDIAAILPSLRSHVSKVFGPGSPIQLEVQTDHTEGYQSLVARVMTDLEAEEALDRLDDLGSTWWYEEGAKFHGLMVMDVGFA